MLSLRNKVKLSNTDLLTICAIIIVAFFIRLWALGDIGFNNDEAVYSGQAATLAGYQEFSEYFSIFRAHPLLFQFTVSIVYSIFGVTDIGARIISAAFGSMTVAIIYFTGRLLYGRRTALVAAFILALIPYHVIVTRQAMVDVPFSFFLALTVFFMAKYTTTENRKWVYAIGASAGLSFLSKEVGALTLIACIVFMLLRKRLGIKSLFVLVSTFFVVISPFLALILIDSRGTQVGTSYLDWQLNRPPNQSVTFYVDVFGVALGYILGALVLLAIVHAFKTRMTSSLLLLTFIAVPLIFFQLWPTKGYHYLVVLVPLFVLLGVSFLFSDWMKRLPGSKFITLALIPLILLSTNHVIAYIHPGKDPLFLAGSGGLPKAREAALWIKDNTPENSVIMTIGPTMGNIIKFYANRETVSLNLNPNKAQHNPAYTAISNPDSMIKSGQVHYLVYDVYSENRSPQTADRLYHYINKYSATQIYADYKIYRTTVGKTITEPIIMVYQNKFVP